VAWSNLITGMKCRRPRDFRFYSPRPEKTFQLYFFDLESRRAEAQFSPWQLGDSAGQRLGGTVCGTAKAFWEILDEQKRA